MNRAILISSASALALIWCSPVFAQVGSGTTGGGRLSGNTGNPAPARTPPVRTTPAATPAPAPAPNVVPPAQRYSPAYYANHGDMYSAFAANNIINNYWHEVVPNSEYGQDALGNSFYAPSADSSHEFVGQIDLERQAREFAGLDSSQFDATAAYDRPNPGRSTLTESAIIRAHSDPTPGPDMNLGPPGSRPVSQFERERITYVQQYQSLTDQRIAVAQILVTRAARSGDSVAIEGAATLMHNLQVERRSTQEQLTTLNTSVGRAFQDDGSAQRYISALNGYVDAVAFRTYSAHNNDADADDNFEAVAARVYHRLGVSLTPVPGEEELPDLMRQNRETTRAMYETQQGFASEAGILPASPHGVAIARRLGDPLLSGSSPTAAAARAGAQSAAAGALGHPAATPATAAAAAAAGAAAGANGQSTQPSSAAANAAAGAAAGANGQSTQSSTAAAAAAAGAAAGMNGAHPTAPTNTATTTAAEDNTPPAPVPTHPDYPTHVRTQAERDAYDRRRRLDALAAEAAAMTVLAAETRARNEAAERRAMEERARISDEIHRLSLLAQRQARQDAHWNSIVADRFNNAVWDAFAANGGTLTTLQLDAIYANYDPLRAPPPAMSLSSAGNSLSTLGFDPTTFGIPLIQGTLDFNDPAVQSLNEVLYGLTNHSRSPFDQNDGRSNAEIADASYMAGSMQVQADPTGRWGRETNGYLAASLFSQESAYLRQLTANGLTGLDALLAQPFNVILTWGANAYDLDLHMTGPLGEATTDRFHIYYAASGSLTAQPYAALIKDCICNSGSEVILTSALNRGGVYRVSVFNFGDQSATSTNLSNASQATIQIVRGGTTQSVGNGTTIVGGRTILTVTAPNGQPGNTWIAAELDPKSGRITVPRTIVQNGSDSGVR